MRGKSPSAEINFLNFKIPRAVFFLGLTSLFSDVAGEVVYPLLPIFLTQVLGAGTIFVGALEGVAESVASLTKFFSGYLSDRAKKREPFVIFGYTLSSFARAAIGIVVTPWQALLFRLFDRIGKGVRGAPRDAWIASIVEARQRGRIFGFHRAMDHAGATIGPLLAALFLWKFPGEYRTLFLLTFIPGCLAVVFIFWAKKIDPSREEGLQSEVHGEKVELAKWGTFPPSFRIFLLILGIFTLGNSSDAFLLLKLRDSQVDEALIPLLWAALHLVKMGSSFVGGRFSDFFGSKVPIGWGWGLYGLIYLSFAWFDHPGSVIPVFLAYGLYHGLTEGPERALIADLVPVHARGTAYGLYHLVLGLGALPASLIFGWIWQRFGSDHAFVFGGSLAFFAAVSLVFVRSRVH